MRLQCRERIPRRWLQRKTVVNNPDMHHGTCVTHARGVCRDRLPALAGKTCPVFPAHAQPAILRIWQEAHASMSFSQHSSHMFQGQFLWRFDICISGIRLIKMFIRISIQKSATDSPVALRGIPHNRRPNHRTEVALEISLYLFQILVYCFICIPGPRLNIKTVLSTYGDFHVEDKTAVRTSYL